MKTLEQLGVRSAPWKRDRQDDIAGRGEELVAFATCLGAFSKGEELANARLVAAAPELYEALREMYEDFEPMCSLECHGCKHEPGCNKWARRARAALEKAGGAE